MILIEFGVNEMFFSILTHGGWSNQPPAQLIRSPSYYSKQIGGSVDTLPDKEESTEPQQQNWISWKNLAAIREFGAYIYYLVYNIFVLKMHKQTGQARLLTEPKISPEDALKNAVAF